MSINNAYCGFSTADVYQGIINDVVSGVKEAFVDDDVELDVLYQIKTDWISRIEASGSVPKKNIKPQNIPPPIRMPLPSQYGRTQQTFFQDGMRLIPIRVVPPEEQNLVIMQKAPMYVPSASQQPLIPQNMQETKSTIARNEQESKPGIPHSFIYQLDGNGASMSDSSSDEEDFDPLRRLVEKVGNDRLPGDDDEEVTYSEVEPPLNSDDDEYEESLDQLLNTENVIICQYEKISRTRAKWKLNLKDGIMHINKKDHCFNRANGEATF